MGKDLLTGGLAIIGGIITLAIVSTFIGKNSTAPAAITATGKFVSGVIAAAVSPASTANTNGQPALNTFSAPNLTALL